MQKKQPLKLKKAKKDNLPEANKQDAEVKKTDAEFPIVGIGASAGGLSAFEAFFSNMPTDTGIAFILVQHLDPDHKSMLTELIGRFTKMQVFEVSDGMRVEPNCTYIIPPNRDMALLDGVLQLIESSKPRGLRLPIDFFFQSLANDLHERAICIILSGTGHDGTQGARYIKSEGGLVIAQNPTTCEFEGMPRSVIEAGFVDFELSPQDMPDKIIEYTSNTLSIPKLSITIAKNENALKKIFILLRAQTSHDFSMYKPNTVYRRIERRMAVHQIKTIDEYAKFIQNSKDEIDELFKDLLIGVTSFFRDPEVFISLKENIFAKLFANKESGSSIRVWVAGCSTGEEAYSIAILLSEYIDELKQSYMVQIFATDIDAQAIAIARSGLYNASITENVSQQRLERFFIPDPDKSRYRISKRVRDMVIFSIHNVIKDPPFSKIDLVSCRNLMIYMNVELQKKLIPLFHYALNPNGFLFLGTSEGIGEFTDLFSILDLKSKIYQRNSDNENTRRVTFSRFLPAQEMHPIFSQGTVKNEQQEKLPLRQLTEDAILQQIAPAAALVDQNGDILYLHGRTGKYLELPSGEVGVSNILKMAREGLQNDLTIALKKAVTTQSTVYCSNVNVKTNGNYSCINLTVNPVEINQTPSHLQPLYIILFKEISSLEYNQNLKDSIPSVDGAEKVDSIDNKRIEELKHELRIKEKFLQTANEKLAESNQELKSYNEEMQSINEELQSTNEELETSKEELQSVNEELSTVNAELQDKVEDLSRSNNDMNNLLAGTGIGTIFVDHKLCILRFTPASTNIINLILSDLGRPIGHIVSNIVGYNQLVEDTQVVLDTLIPKEIEVQTLDDKWYLMRIQPYRTQENVIEGAVISFVNITEVVSMREELKHANSLSRLAVVVRDSNDAITVHDTNGKIIAWNPGAQRIYGWSEDEALNMNVNKRIPKELREDEISKLQLLSSNEILEPYLTKRVTKDGKTIDVSITSTALINEKGIIYAIATTERILNL